MNPTRRTAMHLLASTTLISMPAAVAMAAPRAADPDAGLVALYAEWHRLEQVYETETEAKEPLELEYERLEPTRPDALTWHPFDGFNCGSCQEDLPNGRIRTFYGPLQIDTIRANPPTKQVFVGTTEQWLSDDPATYQAGGPGFTILNGWLAGAKSSTPMTLGKPNAPIADRIGLTAARSRPGVRRGPSRPGEPDP